jgi:hypothetical protein
MALKLSGLKPEDIEVVADDSSSIKSPSQPKLRLSELQKEDIEPIETPSNPTDSPITAITTGLAKGAVPFASSIAGAGRAAMDAITGVRGPLAGEGLEDIVEDYRQARDSFQSDAKKAAEANPKTAFAANVAGGAANPLFRGADSLPKVMGAAAVQSLGDSDTDLTKGEIGNAAKDLGYGAAGGALGYGAGKAVGKAIDAGKYLGKKALTTLGPSEEAINARLAGRAQDSAKSYADLAEDLPTTLKDLQAQIIEKDNDAWNLLSNESKIEHGAIPKEYITKSIDDALDGLKINGKVFGPANQRAESVLKNLKGDLKDFGPGVSEKELKSIVQAMDKNINWDDQSASVLNSSLEKVRNGFDDTLKFRNNAYSKAMEPVAERVRLLGDVKRQFNLKNVAGEGLTPTDTTATKLQTALRDNKAVTQKNLESLDSYTGKDYSELAKDYQLAQQFEKTAPNGSRRAVVGATIGGALGGAVAGTPGAMIGGALGSVSGATLDKYGGQLAGKIIDSYVKAGNSKAFGKFAPVIEEASKRGPQSMAVLGSILSQNPEFRALLESLQR